MSNELPSELVALYKTAALLQAYAEEALSAIDAIDDSKFDVNNQSVYIDSNTEMQVPKAINNSYQRVNCPIGEVSSRLQAAADILGADKLNEIPVLLEHLINNDAI